MRFVIIFWSVAIFTCIFDCLCIQRPNGTARRTEPSRQPATKTQKIYELWCHYDFVYVNVFEWKAKKRSRTSIENDIFTYIVESLVEW